VTRESRARKKKEKKEWDKRGTGVSFKCCTFFEERSVFVERNQTRKSLNLPIFRFGPRTSPTMTAGQARNGQTNVG